MGSAPSVRTDPVLLEQLLVGHSYNHVQTRLPEDSNFKTTCSGELITMLWTIAVILAVLWLVGLVSSYTLGGFIHILLVIAVVIIIVNLVQGRRRL